MRKFREIFEVSRSRRAQIFRKSRIFRIFGVQMCTNFWKILRNFWALFFEEIFRKFYKILRNSATTSEIQNLRWNKTDLRTAEFIIRFRPQNFTPIDNRNKLVGANSITKYVSHKCHKFLHKAETIAQGNKNDLLTRNNSNYLIFSLKNEFLFKNDEGKWKIFRNFTSLAFKTHPEFSYFEILKETRLLPFSLLPFCTGSIREKKTWPPFQKLVFIQNWRGKIENIQKFHFSRPQKAHPKFRNSERN